MTLPSPETPSPSARVVVLSPDELRELVAEAGRLAADRALAASAPQFGLKVSEVAERLSCAESTVYGMIQRGELPVLRLGSAIRVVGSALDTWVKEHARTTG